jgi:hypothetical protein
MQTGGVLWINDLVASTHNYALQSRVKTQREKEGRKGTKKNKKEREEKKGEKKGMQVEGFRL